MWQLYVLDYVLSFFVFSLLQSFVQLQVIAEEPLLIARRCPEN